MTCPGPLIWWYDVFPSPAEAAAGGLPAAILECALCDCGYLIVTGNLHDEAHAETPLLREGLAA